MSDPENQEQQERKTAVKDEEKSRLLKSDPTQLVRAEVLKGSVLGNERVRVVSTNQRAFKRISTDVLEAIELTQAPQGGISKVLYSMKRALIGAPIATAQQELERLTKFKALTVLSSDAISSVAYATEGILLSLVAAGSGVLGLTLPLSFAIVLLLAIVAMSYRQTIPAYPNGGGS